jgi:hypothetical protein
MVYIDGYLIDAAISEDHTLEAAITEHPVEKGANVTDHVRVLPRTLTMEGLVSDTPFGEVATFRRSLAEISVGIDAPSINARTLLEELMYRRERVPITTANGKVYDNMALQSLSFPLDAKTGDACRFKATFKELIIVANLRTTVAVPRAKKKAKLGNKAAPVKATGATGPAGAGSNRTWAAKGLDTLIDAF